MAFLEYLWQAPLLRAVNQALVPYKKSIHGTLGENLHRAYMSLLQTGYAKVDLDQSDPQKNFYLQKWTKPTYTLMKKIRDQIGIDHIIMDMYFRFLIKSAKDGKIPYEKYDPVGFVAARSLQKKFPTEKTIVEKVGETAASVGSKTIDMIPLLLVAGVGVAIYVFTNKAKAAMST